MESWRAIWRVGIAPQLSLRGLCALREALATQDERLCRGTTVKPQPMSWNEGKAPEAACPVGLCGWLGDGLETVGEVEEYFSRTNDAIDHATGEQGAGRYFYQFIDSTEPEESYPLLLVEVDREIARRAAGGGVDESKGETQ